jgi:hypothetical protein
MCVFMDMITKNGMDFFYPSIEIKFKNGEEIIVSYVQYVFIGSDYICANRIHEESEIHEEVTYKDVRYFRIANK